MIRSATTATTGAACAAALMPAAASAHVGHIADAAGHDHWIAGAAIGIAGAIALGTAIRDRRRRRAGDDADRGDASQDAPAPQDSTA